MDEMCQFVTPSYSPATSQVQPIADRVAQNLEIISKNCQFGTRRTRILMGFIIGTIHYVLILGTNRKSHGQNSVSLKRVLK